MVQKFIGGHHDVISGFTIVKDDELAAKLRLIYKTVGACLSAMDSWLVIRGVKTLALRMEQHQKNAIALAEWLKNNLRLQKYCSQVFQNIQVMKSIKPKLLALAACCPLK